MVKKGIFGRFRRTTSESDAHDESERGAAMVEFALIAPLFFAVVFGGIEIGLMFRSYLALENMTRGTARIASIERDAPDADTAILEFIAFRSAPLQGDVTKVIIFKADTLDAGVPDVCLPAGPGTTTSPATVPGVCNSYEVIDGDVAAVAAGAVQTGWPVPGGAGRSSLDNIGIYVEYDYQFATGFFDRLTLSSTTVEVIELDLS